MKKYMYKICSALVILLTIGCSDFLAESSQDELRPASVDDLEQLMLGEGYPMKRYFMGYLDLLTDDMINNYSDNATQSKFLINGASVFSWQNDMYEQMTNQNLLNTNTWQLYYQRIMGCNVVLDNLDYMQGTVPARENLRGQALAMRAYYYFMLVNLYGQPYHAEGIDINTTPGVPLILTSAVKDDFPHRSTIAQVYAQVEKDLLTAAPLLDQYGRNNIRYKATWLFPYAVLSRMYLYMEDWEKAEKYASEVISRNPGLVNLAAYYTGGDKDRNNNVLRINSPELIWGYSNAEDIRNFSVGPYLGDDCEPAYQVSPELLGLYQAGSGTDLKDLRLKFYFLSYFRIVPGVGLSIGLLNGHKGNTSEVNDITKGIRVAEMYLNRAESYIRRYLNTGDENMRLAALNDLNYVREHRYDTRYVAYVPVDYSGTGLLDFYKEERRRELCFEEHRWFDLRRYGMPELRHELTLEKGQTQIVVLPEKSSRYTLPIPRVVLERNPALVPNP